MKQLGIEAVGQSPEAQDSRGFLRFDERSNIALIARRIASQRLKPKLLVSGRYPAPDIEQVCERLTNRDDQTVTLLFDWA